MIVLMIVLAATATVVAAAVAGGVLQPNQIVAARRNVGRAVTLVAAASLVGVAVSLVGEVASLAAADMARVAAGFRASLAGLALCVALDAGNAGGRHLRARLRGGVDVTATVASATDGLSIVADGMLRTRSDRAARAGRALARINS